MTLITKATDSSSTTSITKPVKASVASTTAATSSSNPGNKSPRKSPGVDKMKSKEKTATKGKAVDSCIQSKKSVLQKIQFSLLNDYDLVSLDHCYSKPWNAHPDSAYAKPVKLLFVDKIGTTTIPTQIDVTEELDIEELSNDAVPRYEPAKARSLMQECERHVGFARSEECPDDWEDSLVIVRQGWTAAQNRLFNKVVKVLHTDRLARLSYEKHPNEPVMRRIHIDKTAKRFRLIMSSVNWNTQLTQWLHAILNDNLSLTYLAAYLDILQTLKSKIPALIDKMISISTNSSRATGPSAEALTFLLKRPWDPATAATIHKQKLCPSPVIIIVPNGVSYHFLAHSKRMKYWTNQLASMGKVISLTHGNATHQNQMTVHQSLETTMQSVRAKVAEIKENNPGKQIVFVGWDVGALVACHVAIIENPSAVICLGFPNMGIHGLRGEIDDALLDLRTPTLFVIGQMASNCSQEDMEEMREHMKTETGLVIVGGADNSLRMRKSKRKLAGITQSMVDRCIVDEIAEFLNSALNHVPPPVSTPQPTSATMSVVSNPRPVPVHPMLKLNLENVTVGVKRKVEAGEPAGVSPVKKKSPVSQSPSQKLLQGMLSSSPRIPAMSVDDTLDNVAHPSAKPPGPLLLKEKTPSPENKGISVNIGTLSSLTKRGSPIGFTVTKSLIGEHQTITPSKLTDVPAYKPPAPKLPPANNRARGRPTNTSKQENLKAASSNIVKKLDQIVLQSAPSKSADQVLLKPITPADAVVRTEGSGGSSQFVGKPLIKLPFVNRPPQTITLKQGATRIISSRTMDLSSYHISKQMSDSSSHPKNPSTFGNILTKADVKSGDKQMGKNLTTVRVISANNKSLVLNKQTAQLLTNTVASSNTEYSIIMVQAMGGGAKTSTAVSGTGLGQSYVMQMAGPSGAYTVQTQGSSDNKVDEEALEAANYLVDLNRSMEGGGQDG